MNLKAIEIAIHYYSHKVDYKTIISLTDSELDIILEMVTMGLLVDNRTSPGYIPDLTRPMLSGTERLSAYVQALQDVKIPELRWVQPDV